MKITVIFIVVVRRRLAQFNPSALFLGERQSGRNDFRETYDHNEVAMFGTIVSVHV